MSAGLAQVQNSQALGRIFYPFVSHKALDSPKQELTNN